MSGDKKTASGSAPEAVIKVMKFGKRCYVTMLVENLNHDA